jgi:hypothetical protein
MIVGARLGDVGGCGSLINGLGTGVRRPALIGNTVGASACGAGAQAPTSLAPRSRSRPAAAPLPESACTQRIWLQV